MRRHPRERTGQIGAFFITYEGSIGSGMRRIEAVTGAGAVAYAQEQARPPQRRGNRLHTTPDRATEGVASVQDQLKEAQKRIEALERQIARGETGNLTQQVQTVDGVQVLTGKANVAQHGDPRETQATTCAISSVRAWSCSALLSRASRSCWRWSRRT